MLKILFSLLLLTPPALAQSFDLRTLPENYSFVSVESDALVKVRYIRPDGDEFLFEMVVAYFNAPSETVTLRVNRASQTTYWSMGADAFTYAPHDCAPSSGTCFYSFVDNGETVKVKTVKEVIGDVHITDEYSWSGAEWLFWNRDCTVYDEYGFWVDYVRSFWSGETESGYRQRDTPNRVDELWRMCDPAAAVS